MKNLIKEVKKVHKWVMKFTFCVFILCLIGMGRYMQIGTFTLHRTLLGNGPKSITVRSLECACDVTWYHKNEKENATRIPTMLNTTCSDTQVQFHSNQNVVAYSFYLPSGHVNPDKLAQYINGIQLNVERIRKYLKGFVMRVYTNVPLAGNYCDIVCSNSDIFWCDIRKTPSHGDLSSMFYMTWRFIPLGDPSVNTFLVRDLDSLISEREAMTIKDWLQTNKTFHALRDRKYDHNIEILGGLWGGRNDLLGEKASKKLQSSLIREESRTPKQKGYDQTILKICLFEVMADQFVAYDSYHCDYWSGFMLVKPFPMPRKDANDFAGNPELGGGVWENQECPKTCRPTYGQNWTYC